MFYDEYDDFCSEEFDVEFFDCSLDDSYWDDMDYLDSLSYDLEMFYED